MIIKNITVREFGPLENFSCDLAPGMNIIEGANESGKSSLIGFVRFILYGLPSRRGEDSAADRDRALSWKSTAADGSMTVQCGEGEFRIERRATLGSRENCIDRVKMIDLATGTEVHKGEVPGKVLLGVPQSVFDSTACVRQLDVGALDGAGIGEAIENMLFSADATVSVKNALNKLGAARRSLKNQRGEGKLAALERRRDELSSRLARAEAATRNIREAEAQAEKCRALSTEIRRSLNANEDRLAAYGGLQTLRRFDMLHAGERRIAELEASRASLEASCGFGGYLPDRSYAPALNAAAERVEVAAADRSETVDSAERLSRGRLMDTALADAGDAAAVRYGADWDDVLPDRYAALCGGARRLAVAGAILLTLGIISAGAGAALLAIAAAWRMAAFAAIGAGIAAAVCGVILLALRAGKKRRAFEVAGCVFRGIEEGKGAKLPTQDAFEERVLAVSVAARERAELRALLAQLDATLAKKDATLEAALDEAKRLLSVGGVTAGGDAETVASALRDQAARADDFCRERETLERDIAKYRASVAETAAALADEDETALRARISPVAGALATQNLSDIKKARDFDRARLDSTEERRLELEKKLAALEATAEDPARLYSEWEAAAADAEACRRKFDAVTLAATSIEGAGSSLRLGVTPRLRRDAGAIMSSLTDGRYSDFGVGTDMSVTVGTPSGTRPVSALSVGTRDAAYFSLRSALVGLLFPDSAPPLMLDESLAMMDDDRARRLLAALCRRTADEGGQCIVLSCHGRERALLDGMGEKYNAVEI